MAKLPHPNQDTIASVEPAWITARPFLWRIHATAGPYARRWNELRSYGPLVSARFDPWPPPPAHRDGQGVGYFGTDWAACLSEVFQETRTIVCTGGQRMSGFEPTRDLRLIDLRGNYPVKIGASHAINSGPKNRCRAWARAIRSVHSGHDGFLYTGLAGRTCVVIYSPPGDLFPAAPDFTKPLADPGLAPYIAVAADQIGYALD